jgi:hypothetical protein
MIWRKREITAMRWLVEKASPYTDRHNAILRATVALVYAHWEGFIKTAGSSYLEFVHYKRLKHSQLAPNFVALAARSILRQASATNKIALHMEVTKFFLSRLEEQSRLPYADGVDTGSNLSSALLKEIIETLGLEFAPFETKIHLIDVRLLRTRNTIAHGEYLMVDEDSVKELATEVIGMLEIFRTQIDNAVALSAYRS